MTRRIAILLVCAIAACSPKPTVPERQPPAPIIIVDESSRALAHAAEMDRIAEERARAKNAEAMRAEHARATIVGWVFGLGMACLLAGVALAIFVAGLRDKGIGLAAFGLLAWACSGAMNTYGTTLDLMGIIALGAALVAAIGVIGWLAWSNRRLFTANAEQVRVQEEAKRMMPAEAKNEVYGPGKIADTMQGAATKRIVAKIRASLPTAGDKETP